MIYEDQKQQIKQEVAERNSKADELVKNMRERVGDMADAEMLFVCIDELARRRGYHITYEPVWLEIKDILRKTGYDPGTIMRSNRKMREKNDLSDAYEQAEREHHRKDNV